jgi:lipoprotein-anchoring transpeptidase ErfK/SrfK/nucleotide-binding universal stress UspA family protein
MVVPLDDSARTEAALPLASELARRLGSPIHLLRAIEPAAALGHLSDGGVFAATPPPEVCEQIVRGFQNDAGKHLASVAMRLQREGQRAIWSVVDGSPHVAIANASAQRCRKTGAHGARAGRARSHGDCGLSVANRKRRGKPGGGRLGPPALRVTTNALTLPPIADRANREWACENASGSSPLRPAATRMFCRPGVRRIAVSPQPHPSRLPAARVAMTRRRFALLLLMPLAAALAKAPPAAARRGKAIVVSLSQQAMWVYKGDEVVLSSLVSTGRAGFETPTGSFAILSKLPSQTMEGVIGGEYYNVPDVPNVMYFTNAGHALHGTYWHNNFGTPMSHGCVNLPMDVAAWLYAWAPIGTPVFIVP